MFRFRSVDNLIGKYQELEKQQIYFAALDELNDPLEGTRRYFWQGDKIVWENFLKHYLLCLEHVILLARLLPDDEAITKKDIPIYKSEMDLPTEKYKKRIHKIYKKFFSDDFVQSYLQFVIKNPNKIYLKEMYIHLKMLSNVALESIFEVDIECGIIPTPENAQQRRKERKINLYNVWDEFIENPNSNIEYQKLIDFSYDTLKSWDSELLLKLKDSPKLQSIHIEFSQMYLDSVVELTYPKAYVACFTDNCSNSSIWGTYGSNHTGVCLKFKTNGESNLTLPLKTIVGYSSNGNIYEYRDFLLQPMVYSSSFDELDFFRNLGRLPKPQLIKQWYTDENGNLSICGKNIFSKEDEWRKQHWSQYEGAFLKKLPVWSHEREYRIILSSALDTFDEPKNRLLEYKSENLEAIIFGMNTPKEAKSKIIEIIMRKCNETGRNQFDFYEMEYSDTKNELYPRKLPFYQSK